MDLSHRAEAARVPGARGSALPGGRSARPLAHGAGAARLLRPCATTRGRWGLLSQDAREPAFDRAASDGGGLRPGGAFGIRIDGRAGGRRITGGLRYRRDAAGLRRGVPPGSLRRSRLPGAARELGKYRTALNTVVGGQLSLVRRSNTCRRLFVWNRTSPLL